MRVGEAIGLAAAAALLAGAAPPAAPELVQVRARTLVVGPDGTRAAGQDRALLSPGKTGLLRLQVDLQGGEVVSLELKVRYTRSQPTGGEAPPAAGEAAAPQRPDRAVARLHVSSTARGRPSGETVLRSGGGPVDVPGSLLHEAFVSPATGERIVISLETSAWDEAERLLPEPPPAAPLPVTYRISLYRKTGGGLDFLGMPTLQSLVGRTAAYSFGFFLGEPGGPDRTGEQLELRIHGVELRDGMLIGQMTLQGELRGQPVRTSRGWSLRSGEQETLSFAFGVIAGEEREGVVVIQASF